MQDFVLIRLKLAAPHDVFINGRRLGKHGQFGNLHAVPKPTALRLIDAGIAKLLPHLDLLRLRREVEAAALV